MVVCCGWCVSILLLLLLSLLDCQDESIFSSNSSSSSNHNHKHGIAFHLLHYLHFRVLSSPPSSSQPFFSFSPHHCPLLGLCASDRPSSARRSTGCDPLTYARRNLAPDWPREREIVFFGGVRLARVWGTQTGEKPAGVLTHTNKKRRGALLPPKKLPQQQQQQQQHYFLL